MDIMKLDKAIVYEGKSLIDGANIVAIISGMRGTSSNDKTGNMAQVTIIRSDMHPWEAITQDLDYSICGSCPMRRTWNESKQKYERICYVNPIYGPSAQYKAYASDKYVRISPSTASQILKRRGIGVRGGTYGDPAILPFEFWDDLLKHAPYHTMYTHQWKEKAFFDNRIFKYAMASIDHINTVEELREMHGAVRHYRVAQHYNEIAQDEVKCPSKNNSGDRVVTCSQCKLCSGSAKTAKSIVIVEND